ncbi:Protein kinase C-binding protein NELL1 [Liparis tanakae]|uniref:Protein kinase C-binding protein NELL1 n=1 Tax=Liparis tanakae TaxID=230148 RepID=A0A4Z2FF74_9TELE|nr:Protein kinase C-binding protein NELL1 [Liparis tanakae]
MDLQELLAKMTLKLNYAESRLTQLEGCHCERTCSANSVVYRDQELWAEPENCRNCACKQLQRDRQTDAWVCRLAGITSTEVGIELIKGRASLQDLHSRVEVLPEEEKKVGRAGVSGVGGGYKDRQSTCLVINMEVLDFTG